jgi:hypothetical protein
MRVFLSVVVVVIAVAAIVSGIDSIVGDARICSEETNEDLDVIGVLLVGAAAGSLWGVVTRRLRAAAAFTAATVVIFCAGALTGLSCLS